MNNLSDNEIIKALEWLEETMGVCSSDDEYIYGQIIFDLINRQKAENEQLKIENRILSQKRISFPERLEIDRKARAEAVKEVIETMKPWYRFLCVDKGDWYEQLDTHAYNLVKEMVGDDNG